MISKFIFSKLPDGGNSFLITHHNRMRGKGDIKQALIPLKNKITVSIKFYSIFQLICFDPIII